MIGQELETQSVGYVVVRKEHKWAIFERTRIRPIRDRRAIHATTVTLRWSQTDPYNKDGGFDVLNKIKVESRLSSGDLEQMSEDLALAERRTLRRIISLCWLLDNRVWEEFDPTEGMARPARRAAQREAEEHDHDKHYRIFVNRKRRKPNPDGIGTGEPKKFREHVRAHTRRYKSGRVIQIDAFDKGIGKPERPKPNEYDAWGIDGKAQG
jgi:hypothetical protein